MEKKERCPRFFGNEPCSGEIKKLGMCQTHYYRYWKGWEIDAPRHCSQMKNPIGAKVVRELISYDPETGIVRWKKRRRGVRVGRLVGNEDRDGYIVVSLLGRQYKLHRVIWLFVTGKWPEGEIDHKNKLRWDNRWDNLQDIPLEQNRKKKK